MFRSSGTLRYSPKTDRGDGRDLPQGKWWAVLDCDEEIARYYRSMFNFVNRFWWKLDKPAWGAHISVIANEPPPNQTLWLADAGKEFEFEYEPTLWSNGEYYWLDVKCKPILDLREKLGLKREPFYPLHLTIGRKPTGVKCGLSLSVGTKETA